MILSMMLFAMFSYSVFVFITLFLIMLMCNLLNNVKAEGGVLTPVPPLDPPMRIRSLAKAFTACSLKVVDKQVRK